MSTGLNNVTDLFKIYNVVQGSFVRYSKDLIIFTLREFFKQDSYYHWVSDQWGFNKVPNHTDLPRDAGIHDSLTSRVFIGEAYRFNSIYYPAILVRSGSWRSIPISLNREQHRVDYESVRYVDGYNNEFFIQQPSAFILSGAWEGSITIEVQTRGLRERDDLIELISMLFVDLKWNDAFKSGISIKPNISVASPTESEDRNDKLFKQTVNLDIRTEWRREIPVKSFVDIINFCIDFTGNVEDPNSAVAPNISISTKIEFLDFLANLGN